MAGAAICAAILQIALFLASTSANSSCVMDDSEASTAAVDFYTVDDLNELISSLYAGDAKTILRADILSQLDHIRDARRQLPPPSLSSPVLSSPKFAFSLPSLFTSNTYSGSQKSVDNAISSENLPPWPIRTNTDVSGFSIPSPDFSFKPPSEVISKQNPKPNPFKFDTSSGLGSVAGSVAPVISFEIGNAGQMKKHGRPRRGVTPHKSLPEVSISGEREGMPDFTSFFLNGKLRKSEGVFLFIRL